MDPNITNHLLVWLRFNMDELFEVFLQKEVIRFQASYYNILSLLRSYNEDLFSSVYSVEQEAMLIYDTLFVDIDAKKVGGLKEAYKVAKLVDEELGGASRAYFSGGGFHLYFDFIPLYVSNFFNAVKALLKEFALFDVVDNKVIKRRTMARVPFTINTKWGRYHIPISLEWSLNEILERSKKGEGIDINLFDIKLNEKVPKLIAHYADEIEEIEKRYDTEMFNGYFKTHREIHDFPKCVQQMIDELLATGELDHYQRVHLASFLLHVWPYKRVYKLFSLAGDFNPYRTEYQLRYIYDRKLLPYKCVRVREELGYCPYQDQRQCPFYPWVGFWLLNSMDVGDNLDNNYRRNDLQGQ